MMEMKKYLFLCVYLMFLLSSCDQKSTDYSEVIGCSDEKCRLVYDGLQYYTYDMELTSQTEKINPADNEFQYRLHENDLYITSGNSITNNFKIMKNENEQLQTVYEHKNNREAIFPIAVIDDHYIFSIIEYVDDDHIFKGLFQLNDQHELEPLQIDTSEKTKHIFGIGLSSENNMFLLLHEDGKQNLYKTNASLSVFELVAKDVSQNLSTLAGDVCYTKEQQLFCGNKVMKKLEAGTIFSWVLDPYILEVDDIGNYEVRDITGHQVLHTGSDFIGFTKKVGEVIIYSDGKMLVLES